MKEGNFLDCSPSPVFWRGVGDSYKAKILALKESNFFVLVFRIIINWGKSLRMLKIGHKDLVLQVADID